MRTPCTSHKRAVIRSHLFEGWVEQRSCECPELDRSERSNGTFVYGGMEGFTRTSPWQLLLLTKAKINLTLRTIQQYFIQETIMNRILIVPTCVILVGICTYSMNSDLLTPFPDLSFKSLVLTKGYAHARQFVAENTRALELPKNQFEFVYRATLLPNEIQHKIKTEYLGTGALKSLWAKSYVQYKKLPSPNSEPKEIMCLVYAPDGLLAAAYEDSGTAWLWHSKTDQTMGLCSKIPAIIGGMIFVSNLRLAISFWDKIDLWDAERQTRITELRKPDCVSLANIPKMSTSAETFLSLEKCMAQTQVLQWDIRNSARGHAWRFVKKIDANRPLSLALADDGITFAVGLDNGVVELGDLRKDNTCFMQYQPSNPLPVDSLTFLTSTLIASASSFKPTLSIYDSTKKTVVYTFGHNDDEIQNVIRMNNTTLVAAVRECNEINPALKIIDVEQGYIHHIPTTISTYHPLACDPQNTIATGSFKIGLFRSRLPSLPDNVNSIPLAAYAFAANEDTYEVN
jgi:WD40 repeat protein